MVKLRPNEREGYKNVEIVEGYDRWAPTYDTGRNPLMALEQDITRPAAPNKWIKYRRRFFSYSPYEVLGKVSTLMQVNKKMCHTISGRGINS
jgi:hypothetical protein